MHRKNGLDKAFYFKQFHIHHDRCAMKVGTDGVLLGAWANLKGARKILDVGTGTGLIALMLAQRSTSSSFIDAVEINKDAFEQAGENVKESPWVNKIRLIHSSIQSFKSEPAYDLIVCNPPYFVDSLKPSDENRAQSRHTADLSFSDLISCVKRLMQPNGIFCTILPNREGEEFIRMVRRSSLLSAKKLAIRSKQTKVIERLLIEFSYNSRVCNESELILKNENGEGTESYRALVSPFYLWP